MGPTEQQQATRSEYGLNPAPESAGTPPSHNTIIVAVLAVIVVVLALIYVWTTSLTPQVPLEPPMPPVTEQPVAEPPVIVESVEQLEADLAVPELETLDAGVDQMEAELDQALAE